jgi:hypothetical protein
VTQCCVPTFRKKKLCLQFHGYPKETISAHLVILLQIMPGYNKQETLITTRSFVGSQPLATKCKSPSLSGSQLFSTPQIFRGLLPKVL